MKEQEKTIPPKPQKPSRYECCGSGCNPCVFDYYYSALEKWQEQWGYTEVQLDKPDHGTR